MEMKALETTVLSRSNFIRAGAFGVGLLSLRTAVDWGSSFLPHPQPLRDESRVPRASDLPPATPLFDDTVASDQAIRFLENRLRSDPEDADAAARLASYHLQRLRDTGNIDSLVRALALAQSSLQAVPDVRNISGLTALARAEYAMHDFATARDHALRLVELAPDQAAPYGILGDNLLELGAYDQAYAAYRQLAARDPGVGTLTRLARVATLQGDPDLAQRRLFSSLALTLHGLEPPRETVAWCHWQWGDTVFFSVGDLPEAERHYRDSLTTFPGYPNALASLGRVSAARGDLPDAIKQYEQVVRLLPYPLFVGALGDLYSLAGRQKDAASQYGLVEQIGRLSALNGMLYNRELALFRADHDTNLAEGYADAAQEYTVRHDIFGADTVAWTALKAGKVTEAQAAMQQALRLGTRDARLYYHAGMVARGAGDAASACDYLQRALALNPQFDPLQARVARAALGS